MGAQTPGQVPEGAFTAWMEANGHWSTGFAYDAGDMTGAFGGGWQAAVAAQPQPAPGTLRAELEATVRTWREESEPYPGETAEEIARRGGFGYCADELAQVLARHQP
jgi:hypothetical protein